MLWKKKQGFCHVGGASLASQRATNDAVSGIGGSLSLKEALATFTEVRLEHFGVPRPRVSEFVAGTARRPEVQAKWGKPKGNRRTLRPTPSGRLLDSLSGERP